MALISGFFEKPPIGGVMFELTMFVLPIWVSVLVGILVGWAWKPKWANLSLDGESSQKPVMAVKRQWLTCVRWISDIIIGRANSSSPCGSTENYSSSVTETEKSSVLGVDDLKHLHNLVEKKDNGPSWIPMMKKSAKNMSYQAWRRDPETGPPQYCSRTVYEDATPEILRDFFWDDEFRLTWDDMLANAEVLEKCATTGSMVVRWVRKFPFFCSDREYIIGRRIWELNQTYYCVTKGVPSSTVPRLGKPRRVDLYYSSWCIRAVQSEKDQQLTACEVLLFHHEDMGIPWEIAKHGVRQGMWGAVRKIDPALRAYQKHRATQAPLSSSALMAQINTKVDVATLENTEDTDGGSLDPNSDQQVTTTGKRNGILKMGVMVGAVAVALTLDRGLLTKAVVFGVARRFAGRL